MTTNHADRTYQDIVAYCALHRSGTCAAMSRPACVLVSWQDCWYVHDMQGIMFHVRALFVSFLVVSSKISKGRGGRIQASADGPSIMDAIVKYDHVLVALFDENAYLSDSSRQVRMASTLWGTGSCTPPPHRLSQPLPASLDSTIVV